VCYLAGFPRVLNFSCLNGSSDQGVLTARSLVSSLSALRGVLVFSAPPRAPPPRARFARVSPHASLGQGSRREFRWRDLALGPLTSGARRALTTSHPPACCPPPRAASTHSPPCLKLNVLVCSLPPASRLTASVAARRWTAIASTSVPQVRHPSKSPPSCRTFKHFGTPQTFRIQGFPQGYLGYKKTLARGSVGLRFLKIRKRRENPVGPFFLGLRKRRGRIRCAFLGCAFL
jgi:hypothetical protein